MSGYEIRLLGMLQEYFVAEKKGILRQEVKAPPQNPMSMMSQGGMKNQAVYMITNFGMGHWTSTFFSGFILGMFPVHFFGTKAFCWKHSDLLVHFLACFQGKSRLVLHIDSSR